MDLYFILFSYFISNHYRKKLFYFLDVKTFLTCGSNITGSTMASQYALNNISAFQLKLDNSYTSYSGDATTVCS